jgi:gliding motility-associated lipoprotein GldD
MIKLRKNNLLLFLIFTLITNGCRDVPVPRPKGYFRIDLPVHEYILSDRSMPDSAGLPLSFEYPAYGKLSFEPYSYSEPGWFNIEFPRYKAKIYMTYININDDLEELMEQTYKMNVKNHIIKADAINEQMINNPGQRIFGILYDLKGNTATAVQFFVTDSIKHYLRGSLYFASEPNSDSLAPVIEFFREDIIHLIETLKWKNK